MTQEKSLRVHDMGGRNGLGPVVMDADEAPFHADWEARMWGINEAMTGAPGWTLDWWRHVRELIPAEDYLTRPYFDQWMQVYAAMMVDDGWASIGEIARGKAVRPAPQVSPPMPASDVLAASRRTTDFRRDTDRQPAFKVGAYVKTIRIGGIAHTRLPAYAMERAGVVHAYRGNHIVPDEMARGREMAEPLYTIAFSRADLWPEAAGSRDRIFVDLWERYLEPR
ncbi:nitrile hydratase [Dongia mobilis]|uniref:nitrile hydratase n=1 Tax=Dongia mobilis TaxID=578943 RepID=A0A4R6WJJ2_9PROT|nr:nitrile hydratase subunit beta [Dongia mobilis]TDQ78788.1 nitrile hydratase [Dongia mobilis]